MPEGGFALHQHNSIPIDEETLGAQLRQDEQLSPVEAQKRKILDEHFRETVASNRSRSKNVYEQALKKLGRSIFIAVFFVLFSILSSLTPNYSFGITDPFILPYQELVDAQLLRFEMPVWLRPLVEFGMAVFGVYSLFRQVSDTNSKFTEMKTWSLTSAHDLARMSRENHLPSNRARAEGEKSAHADAEARKRHIRLATKKSARILFALLIVVGSARAILFAAKQFGLLA